jgi:hypothetical protein
MTNEDREDIPTTKHAYTKLEELLDAYSFYGIFVVSRKVGS